jgi:hypothetical protein
MPSACSRALVRGVGLRVGVRVDTEPQPPGLTVAVSTAPGQMPSHPAVEKSTVTPTPPRGAALHGARQVTV